MSAESSASYKVGDAIYWMNKDGVLSKMTIARVTKVRNGLAVGTDNKYVMMYYGSSAFYDVKAETPKVSDCFTDLENSVIDGQVYPTELEALEGGLKSVEKELNEKVLRCEADFESAKRECDEAKRRYKDSKRNKEEAMANLKARIEKLRSERVRNEETNEGCDERSEGSGEERCEAVKGAVKGAVRPSFFEEMVKGVNYFLKVVSGFCVGFGLDLFF